MPRVTLGETQRRLELEHRQRERVKRIISAAAASKGLDIKGLSQKTGMDYQSLCRWLRGATVMPLSCVTQISDALSLDDKTRAALTGSKTKCRFEQGFQEAI